MPRTHRFRAPPGLLLALLAGALPAIAAPAPARGRDAAPGGARGAAVPEGAAAATPLAGWQELVRSQIARQLEKMWGSPVSFRTVEFGLAPPTLALGGLECSTRLWGWRVQVRVGRLSASPALWSLMRGSVEWEQVEVDELEIEAEPDPQRAAAGAAPMSQPLLTRALKVSGASLALRSGSLRLRSQFSLEGSSRAEDGALAGALAMSALSLEGVRGLEAPLRLQGEGDWAWSASGLRIEPLRLRGEFATAVARARLGTEVSRIEIETTIDAAKMPWAPPGGVALRGDWKVAGAWSLRGEAWEASGSVSGGDAVWEEIAIGGPLSGRWKITRSGVEIQGLQATALGGTLTIGARIAGPAFDTLRAEAQAYGFPAAVARRFAPELPPLEGTVEGAVQVELPIAGSIADGSASGSLRLSPGRGAAWPLSAQARFELRSGALSATGRWELGELGGALEIGGGRARVSLAQAALVSLLPWAARGLPAPLPEPVLRLEGSVSGEAEADLHDPLHSWSAVLPVRGLAFEGRPLGEATLRGRGAPGRWWGEALLSGGTQGNGRTSGVAPGAPAGEAILRWEMEPGRPETWSGLLLADLLLPVPGGARLKASGDLRASAASRLSATVELAALETTAHFQVHREDGEGWIGRLSADDGAEGWADLQVRLEPSGALAAARGQVGHWRLRRRWPDEIVSGLLADLLEVSVEWPAGAGEPLARLRLLDQALDGSLRRWGEGEIAWQDGALRLALARALPPLGISGTLRPEGEWPFAIEAVAPTSQVEVAPAARLVTAFGGSASLRGALRPWRWEARLDLERFALISEGRQWLASGPVRGSGSPAGWRLDPLRLEGEAGALDVQVDRASGGLRARGRLSLAPLGRWFGEAEVAGQVEADLHWSPGGGARGALRLSGCRLASGLLPFSVEDLGGEVRLEPEQVSLGQLQGKSSTGTFRMSGRAPLPGSSRGWDLALEATGVPLRQPPGLSGVGDLALRLEGPAASPRLSGEVRLAQGVYTLPLELARGGPLALAFSDALPAAARGLRLHMALQVEHLWLRSDYTRLECQGALEMTGSLARPALRGQLAAAEGGEVRFNEVRYRVVSGLMEFKGGARLDPRLDLHAETERGDYAVHLEVRGTLANLRVGLRSDPPLPTPEIVRLLTTGRVGEESAGLPGGLAGGLVGSVVGGRVLAPLESGLQSFLPVDTLDIDPLAVSGQGDPTARITLGKRLSRRVTLSYSSNLSDNQEELYQLRYRLQPGLEFIASREDDGSIGGDVRLSRRVYAPDARPPQREQEARPILRRIRIHGDSPFGKRRLRSALALAPGEPVSSFDLFDSRDRLWRLHARAGYPQCVVEATLRPRRKGTADAVFEIRAGQRLQVRLEGVDLTRALEEQILDLWQDPDLRALVTSRAEQRISEHFRSLGYPAASARFAGSAQQEGREVWTFEVQSGRRVEVESLQFIGASQVEEKDLLAAIQTRANFPGERGFFVASRLRADTRALEDLYTSRGYRDARAEMEPPQFSPDGRRVRLAWRIEEGSRYRVEEVRVEPEEAAALCAPTMPDLRLGPGGVFSERGLEEDAERLRAALDRRGYPAAQVEAGAEGRPGALRIVYRVDPGPRQVVGEVSVEGNLLTREGVIRRELGFGKGDPLSEQTLADAQRSLYGLGVFRSVSVVAETDATPPEDGSGAGEAMAVPVKVEVLESPPLTLGAGIGYDSDDRFRGRIDLSNRNLFGTRLYAGGVARAGSTERRVQGLVRDPRLFGSRLAGLISAFYEEEEKETFDVVRRGARLQIEQKPTPRVTLFYRYSLSEVDLSEVSVTTEEVEPELRLAHLGWSMAYDSRNDFVEPRRGLFGSLDVKWFDRGLASEADFFKLFLQASYYFPVGRRVVWASGVRAGLARRIGREATVPISERFFAGGDSSVRGFERDRLGPVDPVTDDPLGGEFSLILNQELRFPIWRFLRGVAFYDGGDVFAEPDDFAARRLRHVLGLGLRLDTPIGPVRLDYGHVLDRAEDEEPGRLHFSIGHAF